MSMKPCICVWHDCATLHDSICIITPTSHVWYQKDIRIEFTLCDTQQLLIKKYALYQAIFDHITICQLATNS